MQNRNFTRLINVAIRGVTLLSKFMLIFFLARFLAPAELGVYGLLVATISYSLYLLGLDFYTYSTRELFKCDRGQWGGVLKAHGALTLVLYAIFLPAFGLIFVAGFLPLYVAGWFFILVVLEHLTQELGRLLVAISEQLFASLVLLLRSGIWGVVITVLMFFEPGARSLDFVLAGWALGATVALLLGVYKLSKIGLSGWKQRVDWRWIAKGIRVALLLLVATLAIRGLFTFDRYWFEHLAGLESLGAYVLFMGICTALISFLDAGVFAFIYPGLIGSYQTQDASEFRRGVRKLLAQTVLVSTAFSVIALILITPLLGWLDKPLYSAQLYLFPWLLFATVLYALGMVPHFALYAQGRDKPIIHSHIISLIVFVAATWGLSRNWPHLAVPMGLCLSFLTILCWKSWSFMRLTSPQYRIFQS